MPFRVVIDTNIWISYLLTSHFDFLDASIRNDQIILLHNETSIEELTAVALRPKFEKIISPVELLSLIETIEGFGESVEVKSDIALSRDPDDNFLLSLAVDGRADFLISGDKDLLGLGEVRGVKVISISTLKEILSQ